MSTATAPAAPLFPPESHRQVAGSQPKPQQPGDRKIEDNNQQEDDDDAGLVQQQVASSVHEEDDGTQEQGAALHHLGVRGG